MTQLCKLVKVMQEKGKDLKDQYLRSLESCYSIRVRLMSRQVSRHLHFVQQAKTVLARES